LTLDKWIRPLKIVEENRGTLSEKNSDPGIPRKGTRKKEIWTAGFRYSCTGTPGTGIAEEDGGDSTRNSWMETRS